LLSLVESPLEVVSRKMRRYGARRIIFKLLSHNDNSKQQIYFGGDFDVLRLIPHGELIGQPTSSDGIIFKARLNLKWIDMRTDAPPCPATGAQLILYPRYPEVRMSGFLRGSPLAPSGLMQPPTREERLARGDFQRCLILGICDDDSILACAGGWNGDLTQDALNRIADCSVTKVATVFYELEKYVENRRIMLLDKLRDIYRRGAVRSSRLDRDGTSMEYHARNGAGYTLEGLFGISPNGSAEPDYEGWELKAHGRGAVTLMTPEPDAGYYRESFEEFLIKYGRQTVSRRDFTGRHKMGVKNHRTGLTLRMEGYDPQLCEVVDPQGGLVLRDDRDNVAAGWTFNKLLSHWSRKHAQAAFVTYTVLKRDVNYFQFGPKVHLAEGAGIQPFLNALHSNVIYYDPGINMKHNGVKWIPKKRNQFRAASSNVGRLYEHSETVIFTDCDDVYIQ